MPSSLSRNSSLYKHSLTVYDLATMTSTEVNVEGFAAPSIPLAKYHPVALSPDNRYLVVGHDALRVWDLQNLPTDIADRLPIYRHGGPKALILSVTFSEPSVIETTSGEGRQKWDLYTGAYIP
jgi:WD40 repeat protein